jgi:hypothetical protein
MLNVCDEKTSIVQLLTLKTDTRPSPCRGVSIVCCVVNTHESLAILIHRDETQRMRCGVGVYIVDVSVGGIIGLNTISIIT